MATYHDALTRPRRALQLPWPPGYWLEKRLEQGKYL